MICFKDLSLFVILGSYYTTPEMVSGKTSLVPSRKGKCDTSKGREGRENTLHVAEPQTSSLTGQHYFYLMSWHIETALTVTASFSLSPKIENFILLSYGSPGLVKHSSLPGTFI